jgi:maltooligosyltrehalose trehalohydrolase
LRFFHEDQNDRVLLVNLGADHGLSPAPEPLLAPPEGKIWEILWSSEDPSYGGIGTPQLDTSDNWRVPGHSLLVLKPVPCPSPEEPATRGDPSR